jgi:peroxiredoxin
MSRFAAIFALPLAALIALSLTVAPISAQDTPGAEVDFGPAIGEHIDFGSLADQTGTARDLASLTGENGLVLMFQRSADWCPFCQAQMIEINGSLAEIESRGYALATISYDNTDILSRFTARENIGYAMLYDEGSQIIDKYGLRETNYEEGHRAYGVPKPIVLILSPAGVIEAKLFEENFRVRPPATAVIEALDEVNSGA